MEQLFTHIYTHFLPQAFPIRYSDFAFHLYSSLPQSPTVSHFCFLFTFISHYTLPHMSRKTPLLFLEHSCSWDFIFYSLYLEHPSLGLAHGWFLLISLCSDIRCLILKEAFPDRVVENSLHSHSHLQPLPCLPPPHSTCLALKLYYLLVCLLAYVCLPHQNKSS